MGPVAQFHCRRRHTLVVGVSGKPFLKHATLKWAASKNSYSRNDSRAKTRAGPWCSCTWTTAPYWMIIINAKTLHSCLKPRVSLWLPVGIAFWLALGHRANQSCKERRHHQQDPERVPERVSVQQCNELSDTAASIHSNLNRYQHVSAKSKNKVGVRTLC